MGTISSRTRSRRAIAAMAALAVLPTTALAATTAAAAPPAIAPMATTGQEAGDAQLMLLVDGSRSMEDPDAEGAPKIDAARTALDAVIEGLDPTQTVGMRVFGGTIPVDEPMDRKCTDSELVVPLGTDNATDLTAAVKDYTPTGETPIGLALQDAAQDLATDGNRTILLVSDGIATCDPDPCEVAEELAQDGFDLQVHAVGLGVDDAARSQLRCIASASGGAYYDAEDTDTLTTALTRISTRAFRPFAIQGTPVEGTPEIAGAPELAVGQYTDTLVANDQRKHYLLRRTLAGSTVHVGLAAQAGSNRAAFLDMIISTTDGQECASEWQSAHGSTPLPLVWVGARVPGPPPGAASGDECATAEELVLTLAPRHYQADADHDLEGVPAEIVVTEEPPVAAGNLPEDTNLPEWEEMEVSSDRETVAGGASFNDAPLLEPGRTYDTDILNGEVLLYRVPAEFGQQVQAQLTSEEMPADVADWLGPHGKVSAYIQVISPERAAIDASYSEGGGGRGRLAQFGATETDSAIASSAPILYQHRYRTQGNHLWSTTEGDYFVAVTVDNPNLDSSRAIPFALTVDVIGEPSGKPDYVQTPVGQAADDATGTQDGDATDAAPGSGPPAEQPADDEVDQTADADGATSDSVADQGSAEVSATGDEADGISPLVWVLGGLGVTLAAAGAFVLTTRGRS